MCLFEFPNKSSIKARLKGIEKFNCGHCPECLSKKSRLWALRCSMEARVNVGMMITLTYDTYKYDERIRAKDPKKRFIENKVDPDIPLSKEDVQKFIKRLRKHFPKNKIKYIATAERGKRTGRAHYHALIFGVFFDDLVEYKRSDRGNIIYKSKTLEKIWKNGICTVDCINISAKVARYCTKYCAKDSGAEDTFMLFSHGIGDQELLRLFDGKSYWVDGCEYSIPKQIWTKVIEKRYRIKGYNKYVPYVNVEQNGKKCMREILTYEKKQSAKPSYNYGLQIARSLARARRRLELSEKRYEEGKRKREIYQIVRDNDNQYQQYLAYWQHKNEVFEISRPSPFERILKLPNDKYLTYKNHAIMSKHKQTLKRDFVPPRSYTQGFLRFKDKKKYIQKSFAPLPCHYRANDTIANQFTKFLHEQFRQIWRSMEKYAEPAFGSDSLCPFSI